MKIQKFNNDESKVQSNFVDSQSWILPTQSSAKVFATLRNVFLLVLNAREKEKKFNPFERNLIRRFLFLHPVIQLGSKLPLKMFPIRIFPLFFPSFYVSSKTSRWFDYGTIQKNALQRFKACFEFVDKRGFTDSIKLRNLIKTLFYPRKFFRRQLGW